MSSREFFLNRYRELGWKHEQPKLRQAIRINTANTGREEVIKRLESCGIKLEKVSFVEDGYWIREAKFSVGVTSEYLLGLYSIQEAAAQIPATLFNELKGKIVLDACAAPGGKTVQLADLMQNTGAIIALDVDKRRTIALTNHLERCRVKNAIVYQLNARQASRLGLKFDCILLDVPCSGNFTAGDDWFTRRTIEDVERNAKVQKEILTEAVKILRYDGELIYATCSLEPEEDELNIDWAVKNLGLETEKIDCYGREAATSVFGKRLDDSVANGRRMWPGQTQGFFVCKFRKREAE